MLICAKLLMEGWDDDVELCFMDRARFHSPIEMMQGPGRALRLVRRMGDGRARAEASQAAAVLRWVQS